MSEEMAQLKTKIHELSKKCEEARKKIKEFDDVEKQNQDLKQKLQGLDQVWFGMMQKLSKPSQDSEIDRMLELLRHDVQLYWPDETQAEPKK